MRLSHVSAVISRRELLGLGVAGLLTSLRPGAKAVSARAEGDEKAREAKIFVYGSFDSQANIPATSGVFAIDPETDSWNFVIEHMGLASASHDGKRLIYSHVLNNKPKKRFISILELETGDIKFVGEHFHGSALWSSEDRRVIVSRQMDYPKGPIDTWMIDADDPSRWTRLPFGENDLVVDWSPDDKTVLVSKGEDQQKKTKRKSPARPIHLFDLAGKDLGRVIAPSMNIPDNAARFTPDGKRVCYPFMNDEMTVSGERIVSLDGKDDRIIVKPRENMLKQGSIAWSPDGKRFAASFFENSKQGEVPASHSEIYDETGAFLRRVLLPKSIYVFQIYDWRFC